HSRLGAVRASRLPGQRLQEGSRVVAASVHYSVDEQRRRSAYLPRRDPALDIAVNALENAGACPIAVEHTNVELELGGVSPKVVIRERVLVVKEQLVHVPEPALKRSGLGGGRCGEGVWVDLGQREMPEGKPQAVGPTLQPLDLSKRPS